MLMGSLLAAAVLILSFTVFFIGRDVIGLTPVELQTLVFVMLVATGQGNVYLVRKRSRFWRSHPSHWLTATSVIDLMVVTRMIATGVLMSPVSITLIVSLLLAVAAHLLVVDQLKAQMFRRIEVK